MSLPRRNTCAPSPGPGPCASRLAIGLIAVVFALPALADDSNRPFAAGESLEYRATVGSWGKGTGVLRVKADAPVRGEPAVLLEMDVDARIGPMRVHHVSRSWLSTRRMAALRYEVDERTPVGGIRDRVEIHPPQPGADESGCRWEGRKSAGDCDTDEPLDELSYIYLLRTLRLESGLRSELTRHFDPRRNPAVMQVRGRTRTEVPAGSFDTVVVELEVIDPARLGGSGSMRLHLTDDERRLPVRIESKVPFFGQLVLELLPGGSL